MLKKKSFYYGWIQVLAAWLIYFLVTTPSNYGIIAVLIPNLSVKYNWNSSLLSLCTSAFQASIAIFASVYGFLSCRLKMKTIMVSSALISISGVLLLMAKGESPVLTLISIVFLGSGQSLLALIPTTLIINNWFVRNRAFPMSLMMTSGAVGGFIMPLLFHYLLTSVGESGCFFAVLISFLLSILIVVFVVKEHPSSVGEIPDGKAWVAKHPAPQTAQTDEKNTGNNHVPVKQIFSSKEFYILLIMQFAGRFACISVSTYVLVYSLELSLVNGAAMVSAFSIASFAGRLSVGLRDRLHISNRVVCSFSFLLMTAGCFLISSSASFLMAGVLLIGFGFGSFYAFTPLLVADSFGANAYASAYGILSTAASLAAFLYPVLVLTAYVYTESYRVAYIIGFIMSFLALLSVPFLKSKREA